MATPREAGFFMPAEWEPHAGCWMAWPCRAANWRDIELACDTYSQVARAVARFEPVTMTANARDLRAARRALAGAGPVDVVEVPSDDSWARDTAPTFLVSRRGELAGVDWRFNGDPRDSEARDIVARLSPRHQVVQVPTAELAA